MLKGKTYLKLERRGVGQVAVTAHRTRKPDYDGVWVALKVEIPESVFASYEAALTLPEGETEGVVTIFPLAVE